MGNVPGKPIDSNESPGSYSNSNSGYSTRRNSQSDVISGKSRRNSQAESTMSGTGPKSRRNSSHSVNIRRNSTGASHPGYHSTGGSEGHIGRSRRTSSLVGSLFGGIHTGHGHGHGNNHGSGGAGGNVNAPTTPRAINNGRNRSRNGSLSFFSSPGDYSGSSVGTNTGGSSIFGQYGVAAGADTNPIIAGNPNNLNNDGSNVYKRRSTREKQQAKEAHYRGLVVLFDEVVDGGYLASYGVHDDEKKLDYNDSIVKSLIVARKLQPFHLPLEDYDPDWSDKDLLKIVHSLTLHQPYPEVLEKYEDLPGVYNLNQHELDNTDNIDNYLDLSLTKAERKLQKSAIFTARLYRRKIIWQELETECFIDEKLKPQNERDFMIPSDELYLEMYRNGIECPICFLYYPGPFNISRCCDQPICTECFVQIKRKPPHYPTHLQDDVDENGILKKSGNGENANDKEIDSTEDKSELLISEPACCPYCATPDFGVIYAPPLERQCGINSSYPREYKRTTNTTTTATITNTSNALDNGNSKAKAPVNEVILEEVEELEHSHSNDPNHGSPIAEDNEVRDTDHDQDSRNSISGINSGSNISNKENENSEPRRMSFSVNNDRVVSSDMIRPDWEIELNRARERLRRKYAKATTIHLNNRLLSSNEVNRMEKEMIDKAIKLSLQDDSKK